MESGYTSYNIVDIRAYNCATEFVFYGDFSITDEILSKFKEDIAILVLDRDITPMYGPVEGIHYLKPWTNSDGDLTGEEFLLTGFGIYGKFNINDEEFSSSL